MQVCAGSLTVATIGCRRGGDPAYARGSALVMAVGWVEDVKPDNSDLDFLLFPRLEAGDEEYEYGELEPRLAQNWEHSADYRGWTYHLRTDVRWDNGKPVTAHDVKLTLDLLSHPGVAEQIFESVTVLDDFTVKIRGASFRYQVRITYDLKPDFCSDWSAASLIFLLCEHRLRQVTQFVICESI